MKNSESEAAEHGEIPKLPLSFSAAPMPWPERPGTATPPLQTPATVPFRWEEEPGKPRPCTAVVPFAPSSPDEFPPLDLPPRLVFEANLTKLLSPTSVFDAPFARADSFCSPPSFRIFGGGGGNGGSSFRDEREKGSLGALVLNRERGGGGWFGNWSWRKKKKMKGEITKMMRRSGSFSSISQAKSSGVWATISGSLKQVVPWRNKKQKKGSGGYGHHHGQVKINHG